MKKEYDYMNDRWEVYREDSDIDALTDMTWQEWILLGGVALLGWIAAGAYTAWC